MESRIAYSPPLLYLILTICLLNLIGTGYLAYKIHSNGSLPHDAAQSPLPSGLNTKVERMALFEKIKSSYNIKDYDSLYSLFDEIVRTKVSREQSKETLTALYNLTGQIKNGMYESYEVRPSQNGIRNYKLYYIINTDNGPGILYVIIFQQGKEPFRIMGFRINKN